MATFSGHHHLNNYRTQWSRPLYMYYGRYSGYGAPFRTSTKLMAEVCPNFLPGCILIDVRWRDRLWTCWEWDAGTGAENPRSLDAEKKIDAIFN